MPLLFTAFGLIARGADAEVVVFRGFTLVDGRDGAPVDADLIAAMRKGRVWQASTLKWN